MRSDSNLMKVDSIWMRISEQYAIAIPEMCTVDDIF